MGVRMYFDALGFDVEEAKKLFVLLDNERRGQVSFDDFIFGSVRLRGPARALDLAVIGETLSHRMDLLEQHHVETLSRCMDLLEQHHVETLSRMELITAGLAVKEAKPIDSCSVADGGEGSDNEGHK